MPDATNSETKGTVWVAVQGVLFALFLIAALFGPELADVSGAVLVRVMGILVALGGSALSIGAVRLHGPELSPYPAPVAGTNVITSGVYRFVRHPMYSGVVLFSLGVGLAYAKPTVLAISVAFLVFFAAKSRHEESMLVDFFDDYEAYQASVRWRIVPWIV
jgi:protein-S-isoprenylcysteine O-methyltransferase Ste14